VDAVVKEIPDSQPLPGLEPLIIQPVAQRCATEISRKLSKCGICSSALLFDLDVSFVKVVN
jgi:hypothetical protein